MPTPKRHENSAARQRAYRARKRAKEIQAAAALLGSDERAEAALWPHIAHEVEAQSAEDDAELASWFIAGEPPRLQGKSPAYITEEEFMRQAKGREVVYGYGL